MVRSSNRPTSKVVVAACMLGSCRPAHTPRLQTAARTEPARKAAMAFDSGHGDECAAAVVSSDAGSPLARLDVPWISNAVLERDGRVMLYPVALTVRREPLSSDRFVIVDDAGWLAIGSEAHKLAPPSPCYDGPCPAGYEVRLIERADRAGAGMMHALGPTRARFPRVRRLVPGPAQGQTIRFEQLPRCPFDRGWTRVLAFDTDGDHQADFELRQRLCPDGKRAVAEYRVRADRELSTVALEIALVGVEERATGCPESGGR